MATSQEVETEATKKGTFLGIRCQQKHKDIQLRNTMLPSQTTKAKPKLYETKVRRIEQEKKQTKYGEKVLA